MTELEFAALWGIASFRTAVTVEAGRNLTRTGGLVYLTAGVELLGQSQKIGLRPDDARALGQALIREAHLASGGSDGSLES